MVTLKLPGRITESGELEVELPKGLPAVDVTVSIDFPAEGESDWERQPWTDDEIQELMTPKRKTFKEMVEWLDANPPTEPWGDLRDDEDAAEYVHRMRRQSTIQLEEPGDDE